MQTQILFNARFATRPTSGVDRVAAELLRAMRQISKRSAGNSPQVSLAFPRHARIHPHGALAQTDLSDLQTRHGRLPGHLWEQTELALWNPDAWLVSPCNVGPVLRSRQLAIIHDAQPFVVPESYSRAFRILYRAILPRLARTASVIVTVSKSSKHDLEHTGIITPGKAHVIPNGSDHMLRIQEDLETLRRYKLTANCYFLAVGNRARHKNLPTLIAAAAARGTNAPEIIITGTDTPQALTQAQGSPPTQHCRWIGRVRDAELKALYTHALALVFPSLTEGFGMPPLEAMACGCPVLASTTPAVREVCADAALYADPRIPGEWYSGLHELQRNPSLRAALTARGLRRAAQFTWDASARNYLDLISEAERALLYEASR